VLAFKSQRLDYIHMLTYFYHYLILRMLCSFEHPRSWMQIGYVMSWQKTTYIRSFK